jgi:hypothetical protein
MSTTQHEEIAALEREIIELTERLEYLTKRHTMLTHPEQCSDHEYIYDEGIYKCKKCTHSQTHRPMFADVEYPNLAN